MFLLSIFLTNQLDFTKTIIPLALMASKSIAHSAFSLMDWLRAHSGLRNNRTIARWRYLITTARIHFGFALLFKFVNPAEDKTKNSFNLNKKTTKSRILVATVKWRHRAIVLFTRAWKPYLKCPFSLRMRRCTLWTRSSLAGASKSYSRLLQTGLFWDTF